MEYLISILTMIGTSIVLYFAYIRPLKEQVEDLFYKNHDNEWEIYNLKEELDEDKTTFIIYEKIIDELKEKNKQLRKNGMYKVKKVGRPRKENK